MRADLHIHTSASDGLDEPAEVVKRASLCGLGIIAITDHDTVDGVEPALTAGERWAVMVLGGVEISAEYCDAEVHILGYLPDFGQRDFQKRLEGFREGRLKRVERIVQKLRDLGYSIDLQRVLEIAGDGAVGRPHVAQVLVEQGIADSVADAFSRFIGRGKPAYVPREKISPREAVELVRSAGGVPVLAHPALLPSERLAERLITELVDVGLQGLEVYHIAHTREQEERYLSLSRSFGLVATGGSDYHGEGVVGHGRLGEVTVSVDTVDLLIELAQKNKRAF